MATRHPGAALNPVHQLDAGAESSDRQETAMAGQRWKNKPCQQCGKRKSPKQALDRYCATCDRLISKERARAAYGKYLERTYGITIDEYEAIKAAQGGVCFICRRANGRSRRLSTDHDHRLSGRESVRGCLCRPCNSLLGHLRDDPDAVARILVYLAEPPARVVLGIESGYGLRITKRVVRRGRRVRQPGTGTAGSS